MLSNVVSSDNSKPTSDGGGFALLWTPFVLVPEQLLDSDNHDLWLNFLRRRIPRDQKIAQRLFSQWRCACLYEVKNDEQQHIIALVLQKAIEKELETVVCAVRQGERVALVCIKDGALQLGNIYEAATKEQLLFWVLTIYKQLQLPDSTPLYIQCGDGTRKLLYSHLDTREL